MNNEHFAYLELQNQMHQALRSQHPEWIEPNGESLVIDSYEARFAELLALFESQHHREAA